MVRAVVVSLLGLLIGVDAQSERLRYALGAGVERRPLDPGHGDVPHLPHLEDAVVVDVDGDPSGWNRRMLSEVGRAEQSLLFGRNGREDDRSLRLRGGQRPDASHLQEHGAAAGVVDGAVVNRIAILRFSNPEVIVMCGVEDRLVAELRVAAGKPGRDVGCVEAANRADHISVQLEIERDGAEVARGGLARQRIEIETGRLHQRSGHSLSDP